MNQQIKELLLNFEEVILKRDWFLQGRQSLGEQASALRPQFIAGRHYTLNRCLEAINESIRMNQEKRELSF